MPLILPKDRYVKGDMLITIEKSHYPDPSRVARYSMDLKQTHVLDVRVGQVKNNSLDSHYFIRMVGAMYFNPHFYSGIGFDSPLFTGYYFLPAEQIVGAAPGTIDRTDPKEVKAFLTTLIKYYRPYLSDLFSDMVLTGREEQSRSLPFSFFGGRLP